MMIFFYFFFANWLFLTSEYVTIYHIPAHKWAKEIQIGCLKGLSLHFGACDSPSWCTLLPYNKINLNTLKIIYTAREVVRYLFKIWSTNPYLIKIRRVSRNIYFLIKFFDKPCVAIQLEVNASHALYFNRNIC